MVLGAAGIAHADGTAVPDSLDFHSGGPTPGDWAMNTTFGFLHSEDSGAHWDWTCHEAVLTVAEFSPPTTRGPDGTLYITLPLGYAVQPTQSLWRTGDGGCNWSPTPSLENVILRSLAFRPGSPEEAIVVGSDPSGATAQAWRSTDGALSFSPLPILLQPGRIFLNVAWAPSDPQRVYVAAITPSPSGASLFRSDDAGASWSEIPVPFSGQPPVTVLGISPLDPDVVWVRNDTASDRLLVTTNGGASFTVAATVPGDITGFALTDGGNTRWLGARLFEGLRRATSSSPAFAQLPGSPVPRCLDASGNTVFVCAAPFDDPFAAASTTDGLVYTTAMTFRRITGPRACPTGSTSATICEPLWPSVAIKLGLATPVPSPSPTPSPGNGGNGGCRCDVSSPRCAQKKIAIPFAFAIVTILIRRRRFLRE